MSDKKNEVPVVVGDKYLRRYWGWSVPISYNETTGMGQMGGGRWVTYSEIQKMEHRPAGGDNYDATPNPSALGRRRW